MTKGTTTWTQAQAHPFFAHLECMACGRTTGGERLVNTSECCGSTLLARYDLERARDQITGKDLSTLFTHDHGLWRYRRLLPPAGPQGNVSLGEGGTPLLDLPGLAERHQVARLCVKDETRNPTGTFKARGMSLAVTRARALGADHLRAPTAGNAGAALASYAARAGLKATVAMPRDAPETNKQEVRSAGARLLEVDGLIPDCAKALDEDPQAAKAFDVSTLNEPYRMEGKKTMGFELWEQHGGVWPDVVVFPTGGGMGILALKKAHDELAELGVVNGPPPRLVAVQSTGCPPLVRAFEAGEDTATVAKDARTVAGGIRVPRVKADREVLRAIRETGGAAVGVTDDALLEGMGTITKATGILVSPEAGAAYAGMQALRGDGRLDSGESATVFLTGTGLKHMDLYG